MINFRTMLFRAYKSIALLLPGSYSERIRQLLVYCDLEIPREEWVGFSLLFSIFLSIPISILIFKIFSLTPLHLILLIIGFFILLQIILLGALELTATARGAFVEEILPDALSLIASNLRSGMTTERAVLLSARSEFGPLEKEFRMAAKRILAGETIDEALRDICLHIKSKLLERTMQLLVESIKSGGEISKLLEEISMNIRDLQIMKKDIRANVMSYTIFILMAAGFGAPLLFAISTSLIETIIKLTSAITLPPPAVIAQMPTFIRIGAPPAISTEFLTWFSIFAMLIISVFSGLIIGSIEKGDERGGVKYIPLLLGISLATFFLTKIALKILLKIGT
ncbi:MAG: type II secretion system F family protein [Candidatus Parvarchaeota archaeon]|nr:type II secretion system F family protein [Candidatus Jingweiarchaeum tengchongense]